MIPRRCLILILLGILVIIAPQAVNSVMMPSPPVKPDKFHNYKQFKEYLVKCLEYYAINGRPKFGWFDTVEYATITIQII